MDVNECSYDQSYDGRKNGLPERVEVRARLERRRRWSSAAKLAIIRETLIAGTTAQAVADRHEICTSLIYTWLCGGGRRAVVDGDGRGRPIGAGRHERTGDRTTYRNETAIARSTRGWVACS